MYLTTVLKWNVEILANLNTYYFRGNSYEKSSLFVIQITLKKTLINLQDLYVQD